jgi:uncharacterized membrane protein YbhN (UPF0104 family)
MAARNGPLSITSLAAGTASIARRLRETAALRVAGHLLAAGLVVVLALRLWQLWRREPVDFGRLDGGIFVLAVLASVVAVTAYGLVWPYLLRRLGTRASAAWVLLFFKSQLGKYVPGSVWQYAGRVGLARSRGVPVQRALVTVVAEVVLSAAAAGVVGLLVFGPRTAALAWAGLAALALLALPFRRRPTATLSRLSPVLSRWRVDRESLRAGVRAAPSAGALYFLVWGVYGLAFWLTARALFAVPVSELPRYVGVFSLGWLVGLVAVFAPGGVGVREAVITALLSGHLGQADAILLAGTSRVVLTAVDLVGGAAALSLPLLRGRRPKPVEARR